MAEEKAEKKKPTTIGCIFKWIGVGLLSLLLIAGVIFQAPWKVIALLLVFLCACTVLPKPARKWFWAGVGVVILALIIWVFLPDSNQGWRPYTFDEELAALEAKYAVPDEENAATVYNQLLADYDSNSFLPEFWDWPVHHDIMSEAWSSKEHFELAQWLAGHQDTIERLLAAARRPKCRCPIRVTPFESGERGRIPTRIRSWAGLLVYAANNDLAEGRTDQALEKLAATVQMARHLYQPPTTMIEPLVGIAVEAMAVRSLNGFVVTGEGREEHLSVIEKMLGQIRHEWSEDLPRILEGDKLAAKDVFGMVAYEVNREGKVRLNRDPAAVAKLEDPEYDTAPTDAQIRLGKVTALFNWFVLPSSPGRAGKIIDKNYEHLYAMARPDFKWPKERKVRPLGTCMHGRWEYLIWLWTGPPEDIYYKIHDLYQRIIAENRAGWLIVGLRRYKNKNGRWPEKLEEIRSLVSSEAFTDPINGGPFVYKVNAEGFTLYSKGKNNIDEEGKYDSGWPREGVKRDDWLIWPPRGREIKQENANAE